jgi:hypothetical protein
MKINLTLFVAAVFLTPMASLQAQYWSNSNVLTTTNSNVGIGTTSPGNLLTVYGAMDEVAAFANNSINNTRISVRNQTGAINLGIGNANKYGYVWSGTGNVFIGDDGAPTMMILGMNNGSVGIGTWDTKGYKLAVNGSAIFTKVVTKAYGLWPDYVFNSGYKLPSLVEVEQYINQYHHLPEVVAAEEVDKNGLDLAENQAALLKKVEELTLYMIDQSKKQQKLEEEVAELRKENEALKELVGKKKTRRNK